MRTNKQRAWALDQLHKSLFFHQKLHEWGLIEVAQAIEDISGETLDWDNNDLNISDSAWNRIIHSGIKPIIVFAHPTVMMNVSRAVGYYRMLSLVSQKSMSQIGIPTKRFEDLNGHPDLNSALRIARRCNQLISALIDSERVIDRREFDLWRGLAAGSQAQGSWQNRKGDSIELIIRQDFLAQLYRMNLVEQNSVIDIASRAVEFTLVDGRIVRMGSEPDILIFSDYRIYAAVEVKGGIDTAGVLERVGASIKSLSRAKEESPGAITILLMAQVSLSDQAMRDIESNKANVNYLFTIEDILDDPQTKQRYYGLMGLAH